MAKAAERGHQSRKVLIDDAPNAVDQNLTAFASDHDAQNAALVASMKKIDDALVRIESDLKKLSRRKRRRSPMLLERAAGLSARVAEYNRVKSAAQEASHFETRAIQLRRRDQTPLCPVESILVDFGTLPCL